MPTSAELRQQADIAETEEREAARLAEERRKQAAREMNTKIHAARAELVDMRKAAADVLAAKPDLARPSGEVRALARAVLRDPAPNPLHVPTAARLSSLDQQFADLAGNQDAAQRFVSRHAAAGVGDEALHAAADDLECALHRGVVARLRWLGGEVEP